MENPRTVGRSGGQGGGQGGGRSSGGRGSSEGKNTGLIVGIIAGVVILIIIIAAAASSGGVNVQKYDIDVRVNMLFDAMVGGNPELALNYISPGAKEEYYKAKADGDYGADEFLFDIFGGMGELGAALPSVGGVLSGVSTIGQAIIRGGRSLNENFGSEDTDALTYRLGELDIVFIGSKYAEARGVVTISGNPVDVMLEEARAILDGDDETEINSLAAELGLSPDEISFEAVREKLTTEQWAFFLETINGEWYVYKTEK
jgi:hypothetical protein